MLRLSLSLTLLVLLALPAAASASSSQSLTFEAPRELLDPSTRDRTLEEIRDFGVDRVRVLVYWQDFAPVRALQAPPGFDAADPDAYPRRRRGRGSTSSSTPPRRAGSPSSSRSPGPSRAGRRRATATT